MKQLLMMFILSMSISASAQIVSFDEQDLSNDSSFSVESLDSEREVASEKNRDEPPAKPEHELPYWEFDEEVTTN